MKEKNNDHSKGISQFDPSALEKEVETMLDLLNIRYSKENPDPEQLHFFFQEIPHESIKGQTGAIIYLLKGEEFRLNVISSVKFSPQHIEALRKLRKNELSNFIFEIRMWTLPRDGWLDLDLDLDNSFENARYVVIYPIYPEEFSLGALEKNRLKAIKMAELVKLIIQKHLNRLFMEQ